MFMHFMPLGEGGFVMAQLPECPTFREGKGQCERSQLILAFESETFFNFRCLSCGLDWVWTKPRTKQAAIYERDLERVRQRTKQYREQEARARVFGAPKGGWAE